MLRRKYRKINITYSLPIKKEVANDDYDDDDGEKKENSWI